MSFQGTSTSSLVQNRFSTMRLRSFRWSRLKASASRGSVAETRLIGTVTRPKLIEPFHSARGGMSAESCNRDAIRVQVGLHRNFTPGSAREREDLLEQEMSRQVDEHRKARDDHRHVDERRETTLGAGARPEHPVD